MQAGPAGPAAIPPPDVIRRTAEEVIRRSDYDLSARGYAYESMVERLLRAIARAFERAAEFFARLYDVSPVLAWFVVIALLLVAAGLVFHIAYTLKTALAGRRPASKGAEPEEDPGLDPEKWERMAGEAARRQDYIGAVRCLFRACLLRLEAARRAIFRRGYTNRQYLRRFAGTPASEHLSLFVETIDMKWYGRGASSSEDYERCARAHAAVREIVSSAGVPAAGPREGAESLTDAFGS